MRTATRVVDTKTPVRSIKFNETGEIVLLREDGEGDTSDTVALFDVRTGENLHRVSSKDMGVGRTVRTSSMFVCLRGTEAGSTDKRY